MSKIRILSEALICQIAAGEVIERPAAALKEIVENAIDAGGVNLSIQLLEGGKTLIDVEDDGTGMSREDVELSLQRHATSKLPLGDLFDIHTFGFRGEALASIASVSRFSITSRSQDPIGWKVECEAGGVLESMPHARPRGTRVIVRDLFCSTPARLKFLKSTSAELLKCYEWIDRLALSSPHVSFSVQSDQRLVRSYPSVPCIRERIIQVLGNDIEGNTHFFSHDGDGIKIEGALGLPTYNRRTSSGQYFFLNNRFIKDRLFLSVLRSVYGDLVPKERYPVCILFLKLEPSSFDVNVHPMKTEVRFQKVQELRHFLVTSLKKSLGEKSQETASYLTFATLSKMVPAPYVERSSDKFSVASVQRKELPSFIKKEIDPSDVCIRPQILSIADTTSAFFGRAIGQCFGTYILSQTESALFLIDQHAAHERIYYEKLKEELAQKKHLEHQSFLIPHVIDSVEEGEFEVLKKNQEYLKVCGISYDLYESKRSVVIRSFPIILKKEEFIDVFFEIIHDLSVEDSPLSFVERCCHHLATYACYNSVRSGRILSLAEMNALLCEMERGLNTGQCNHGRPTYIQLGLSELTHLFERS